MRNILGFGQSKTEESQPTAAADAGTLLACERTAMAAERTLMGWIRTALSMISFGFAIGKLTQALTDVEPGLLSDVRTFSIRSIAYFLVLLGMVALLGATIQYTRRIRALRVMGFPREVGIAFIVAVLLILVGGFAFTSLVMEL